MHKHGLTQRRVAELCFCAPKTVESWLAQPGASSRRAMPNRALATIRLQIEES